MSENAQINPQLLQEVPETDSTTVMLYDLTPIRDSIQKAINDCDKQTDVLITSKKKIVDTHTIEIIITVLHHPRGPGGGDPSHPPKKAILWE